jgi:hypothetical protein
MDMEKIKQQAITEIEEEDFRAAVEKYKLKLRTKRSIWDRVFPYKIIFIKKENPNG